MEDKEKENEIIFSNNYLPPEPLTSEVIINKNANNINHDNCKININNINKNNSNSILLKNPMSSTYNNMMLLYYINQIQKNNINNLNMPYNNNRNSININKTKNNFCLNDLAIDINTEILNKLSKENLIDIIIFIRDICKVKIDRKFIHLKHQIFRIIKDKSKYNCRLFTIKKRGLKKILSQQFNELDNIINNSGNNNDDDEKDNIINEQNIINSNNNIINKKNHVYDSFYCKVHNKVYINADYEAHCKYHIKCEKCGAEFKKHKILRSHIKYQHPEYIQNEKNDDKIKCPNCNLLFNSSELMSIHYNEIHGKKNSQNNINNEKEAFQNNVKEIINKPKKSNKDDLKKQKEKEEIENKKKDELRKLEEQKRIKEEEEPGRQEELKRQEKLKFQIEENPKQKQIQKQQEEKRIGEMILPKEKELNNFKREEYYYICYHDGKTFENERKYVQHFNKFHSNDFPFYCNICNRGFYSYSEIDEHNRAKRH